MVSVCLPGGDGLILNKFGGAAVTLNTQIQNIQNAIDTANNYSTYDTSQITNALNNVSTVIEDYIQARRNDITYDPNTLNYFKSIASRSLYSSEAACTSNANFMADTIVQSTAAINASEIPCSGAAATGCTTFAGCGVSGCQDMYAIYNGGGGDSADATSRYGGCSVSGALDYIKTNWHDVRTAVTGIPAVKDRYETVGSNPKGTITNIVTTMTALKTNMTSVFSNLNTTINSVVDPTYGLFAGINCRTLGDDTILFKNTICVTLFNSLFFMFVTIGTSSFALLFSMCCIVCSGVRHYKQAEVKKKLGQSLNQDSSSYMVGAKY